MIAAQFDYLFTSIKNNNIDNCKDALKKLNIYIKDNFKAEQDLNIFEKNLLTLESQNKVLSDREIAEDTANLVLSFLLYNLDKIAQPLNLQSCATLSKFAFKIFEDSKLFQDNIETALLYRCLGKINYLRWLNSKNDLDSKTSQKLLDKSIDDFFLSSSVLGRIKGHDQIYIEVLINLLSLYKEQLQAKLNITKGQYSEFADEPLDNFIQTLELIETKFGCLNTNKKTAQEINEYSRYKDSVLNMREEAHLVANSHSPSFKKIKSPAVVFSPPILVQVSTFENHDISPYFEKQNNGDFEVQQILEKKPKVVFYPLKVDKLLGIIEECSSAESTPIQSRRASDASASPKSMSPKNF